MILWGCEAVTAISVWWIHSTVLKGSYGPLESLTRRKHPAGHR